MSKRKCYTAIAAAGFTGAVIGWNFTRIFAPKSLADTVEMADRLGGTAEDLIRFINERFNRGDFDHNPEFVQELSDKLTWLSIVLEEEL